MVVVIDIINGSTVHFLLPSFLFLYVVGGSPLAEKSQISCVVQI